MRSSSIDARAIPDVLASKGLRLTAPRRAVIDVLVERGAPLTVADIHGRLRKARINLVSVYRTLRLLMDLGLVRLADEFRGTQRFELAEVYTGHHHHLVCQRCGQVEDIDGCWLEEKMLETLNRRLRRTRRFRVTAHDLKLYGLCRGCGRA
jgi:Fur family transcriptional regulator, ferric uptake regulator